MKKILACMVVMAFATIAVEADAQSLLKKIGKAVEKEIVNELKSKNEEKKQSPQQAKPQQPATANTPTQSNATQKQSYASADPSSINVPISEVYPNAQFYNEGVTGATTIIDGIEYVILADKKYAYLNCVEKSNRGKTSNVKVWGGIRYKGVVYPVMYIGPHAFEGESLTSVQLPSTLQEIREEAFCHSMLKSVVIHSSTWRIGKSAFADTPLESVRISNGVKKIEGGAFAGCINLTQVMIPESVTSLDRNIFEDCEKLTEVVLPRNIKTIPVSMFQGCTSLTSFPIPGNIEKIDRQAFALSGITSVNIPLGVKIIEDNAFDSCKNLTTITIPSSVESFGDFIFVFCDKLTTARIHEKHKSLAVVAQIFMGVNHIITSENLDECKAITWTN